MNVLVVGLFFFAASVGGARASLMAYDGFLAGGSSPNSAVGEYETGTGYPSDFLSQQNPTTLGFSASAWAITNSAYASTVYYRTENDQRSYTDAQGQQLVTSPGQLNLFRSAGSSNTDKDIYRDLSLGPSLPDTLYMSILVEFSAGESFALRSASTDGISSRRFNFGINAAGNPYVTGTLNASSVNDVNTSLFLAPGVAHLLVLRLRNVGSTNDEIALFVDPLMTLEGLNTPIAEVTTGSFYVGGNPAWTLQDIYFRARAVDAPSSVIMDELRIGTTWEDVTPHLVPEPGSFALMLVGFAGLTHFRRRA